MMVMSSVFYNKMLVVGPEQPTLLGDIKEVQRMETFELCQTLFTWYVPELLIPGSYQITNLVRTACV